jgi:hypothetical protein
VVLGLLTSLHINNHFQWHDGVMKAFVMHTIPVLKVGKPTIKAMHLCCAFSARESLQYVARVG